MKSFLIDLDGVLYVGKEIVDGAKECLEFLKNLGYQYRFVSNSTRRSKSSVAERLKSFGYDIPAEQIFTPSLAAIEHVNRSLGNRCFLLTTGDVNSDFKSAGITIAEEDVNFVIVGDAGKDFTYERLNKALSLLLDGADMLALEKDRYWLSPDGLALSAGPFVAALEYATGKRSELMGKPSPEFFNLALKSMGVTPGETAMIGDDILTDVFGAQKIGMEGILVKTGKYREDHAKDSGVIPDLVLESIAELVEYL